MKTTTGYSLWLMPSGKVKDFLFDKIRKLSKEFFTPVFEPHVTLIGQINMLERDIIDKTAILAGSIHPFTVKLGSIDGHNEYFRCLFSKIEESAEIMQANQAARQVFNRQDDPSFMPHLSLLYGLISSDFKEEIVSEIEKGFSLAFEATAIHIVATIGAVSDWKKVAEIPVV